MNDTIIQVKHLFAGYDGTAIMEDISFDVKNGEVFVILGGSGCGKSTVLKHMIGLVPPISGQVLINGKDMVSARGRDRTRILQRIGVAFQNGALFGSITVLDNIMLPLREFTDLPAEAIEAIARAMALDPAILFLDEPSAGLDPLTSAGMDSLILELAKSLNITFVIVTHELESILAIADRTIMLDKKSRGIIAQGPPAELKADTSNTYVHQFFNRNP